jgi:hypothetical protein
MKRLLFLSSLVLLLGAGCSSSHGDASGCVTPVLNAPCTEAETACPTARVPLPSAQCGPCVNDSHWKAGDGCFEAQGWGCMGVGDTNIWSFSGAIVCQSPDGGS